MIIVPPTPFIRRAKAKSQAAPPPPPVVDQILAVTHSESGDELVVSLSAPLVDKGDVSQMLQASVDGTDWIEASEIVGGPDPMNITIAFDGDVSAATMWRVVDPTAWIFADAATLEEPYAGEIGDV